MTRLEQSDLLRRKWKQLQMKSHLTCFDSYVTKLLVT